MDTTENKHLGALDGLRFVAFLMVFFFHVSAAPEYGTLLMFQKQGWVGVEVFFAISSFLLFSLFEQEHGKIGTIRISQFYVRRLLRIYPLMMIFSIVMLAVYGTWGMGSFGWILSLASFVGNYVYWFPEKALSVPNTGHLWSLPYEFQVYAILPLLFLTYRAVGKRAFVMALLCALPICLIARAALVMSGLSIQSIYMTPILRPESTIAGILMAIGVTRGAPTWAASLLLLASAIGLLALPDMHRPIGTIFAYVTAALFSGALLHTALYSGIFARLLSWPPIAYLGRISFGLYIFHIWAFIEGMTLLRMTAIPENYGTRCLAGLALCVATATVSYYLLERPILALKPRAYGTRVTAGSASTAKHIANAVGSAAARVFQRS